MNTRIEALKLIDTERNRQDAKWGEQNHESPKWVAILGEEFGEYCQAVNETVFDNGPSERIKGGSENMVKELTHVAAVAVGAIECLMRAEAKENPSCEICRTEVERSCKNCAYHSMVYGNFQSAPLSHKCNNSKSAQYRRIIESTDEVCCKWEKAEDA